MQLVYKKQMYFYLFIKAENYAALCVNEFQIQLWKIFTNFKFWKFNKGNQAGFVRFCFILYVCFSMNTSCA